MPNEYQGAPFGTVLPSGSTSVVDNYINYKQKQRDDAEAQQDFAYKQQQSDKKREDGLDKYVDVFLGSKENQTDPTNPYAPLFDKDLADISKQLHSLVKSGADRSTLMGEARKLMLPMLQRKAKFNNTVSNIKLASAAQDDIVDKKALELAARKKAFLDANGKPSYDMLDALSPDTDYVKKTLDENLSELPIKPLKKVTLTSTILDKKDGVKNPTTGHLETNEYKAFINPAYHEMVPAEKGGAPTVRIKGSVPTLMANHQPMMQDVGTGKFDPETGDEITTKQPVMQLSPEAYSYYAKELPQLHYLANQELLDANRKLLANHGKKLEGQDADNFILQVAYHIIDNQVAPLPHVYDNYGDLTAKAMEKAAIAQQTYLNNRKVAANIPLRNPTAKDPWGNADKIQTMNTINALRRDAAQILAGTKKGFTELPIDEQGRLTRGAKKFQSMSPQELINYYRSSGNSELPEGETPKSIFEISDDAQKKTPVVQPPPKPTVVQKIKKALGLTTNKQPSNDIDFNQFKRK